MLQGLDLPKYWNFCFVCSPAWGARFLCRWRFNQLLVKIKSAQACKHILIHMCICTMEIYPMGCKYTEKSDRLRSWGRYRNCSACLWAQRCQRFQDSQGQIKNNCSTRSFPKPFCHLALRSVWWLSQRQYPIANASFILKGIQKLLGSCRVGLLLFCRSRLGLCLGLVLASQFTEQGLCSSLEGR